jgi:hypothetical protein
MTNQLHLEEVYYVYPCLQSVREGQVVLSHCHVFDPWKSFVDTFSWYISNAPTQEKEARVMHFIMLMHFFAANNELTLRDPDLCVAIRNKARELYRHYLTPFDDKAFLRLLCDIGK